MQILRIELYQYKRILLNDIQSLIIDFTSPYQILLGTNGSGKSSVLNELSPLPGHPNDFNKGGYKIIDIHHNNKTYKLTSDFRTKVKHSFIKDDVEMNEGGTITVQKDLVLEEFGLTDELHKFLLGKTTFTQMSPVKRRELISKMSDVDQTYVLGIHRKIMTLNRDSQGIIKHVKERLTRETATLSKLEENSDTLQEDILTLQNELSVLMSNKHPNVSNDPSRSVRADLERLTQSLHALSSKIIKNPVPHNNGSYKSIDELSELIHQCQSEITINKQRRSDKQEEYDHLMKLISDRDSIEKTPEDLTKERDAYLARIQEITIKKPEFTFQGDQKVLVSQAHELQKELSDILTTLPDNSTKQFSRSRMTELKEKHETLRMTLNKAVSRLSALKHDVDVATNTDHQECPQCKHTWQPGISKNLVRDSKKLIADCEANIESLTKSFDEVKAQISEIEEYGVQFGRLRQLQYNYPSAGNLFEWLKEDDRIYFQPSQYTPVIGRWYHTLTIHQEITTLTAKIEFINDALERYKSMESIVEDRVDLTVMDLENSIDLLTGSLWLDETKLKELTLAKNMLVERYSDMETFQTLYSKIKDTFDAYVVKLRNEHIDKAIYQHQQSLSVMVTQSSQRDRISDLIVDLEKDLEKCEREHKIYKLLVQALSPTEGIVAEQMTSFIEGMCAQMNDIMEAVYTYPIKIVPCARENGDLDYKFPIISGDDSVVPPDISMGSDGQQELIDFAFKLVALNYLGLQDYPLYLDEIGRRQDEQHLTNIMNYVKLTIDTHRHNQLFMISHYATASGMFTNAEVLVLNSSNITVPNGTNQHATIE